ncbi:DUF2255 family protein [Nocardiopsis sp. MG754419]|uniref:DUF2255 family protein n=1 Tax=Nocardiopsis sp. MG754419 TaxID=2259865 RepID=UPI001BA7EF5A|nr:DUF2255 family protein [Nocardiopsis sp. MG754419]MBR8745130.1 DUF2255 domain-containing protein [Nocardiopsis sp. MG754419]
MSAWTEEQLDRIGRSGELRITSRGDDGALRRSRIIWVVREGDELYIRSVNGVASSWYRGTRDHLAGHVSAGGVDADVAFEDADVSVNDRIDAAYRDKYGAGSAGVDAITSDGARSTTMRLVPAAG